MLLALFLAAQAASADVSPQYADCVELVNADLEIGRIAAQQWVSEGGGAEAEHCLAMADRMAGFPKLAAIRLQDLAQRKDAGDDYVRARLLAQAAEAWLAANDKARAENALNEALTLVPDSGELQLTAALVYGAQERWSDVITAVTKAEEAGLGSARTYVLRGRARYTLGAYEEAADDVVAALSIDPKNLDALVLRGDLQQRGMSIDVFVDPRAKP
ncbi:MAG: hypothetical protein R3C58_07035 [Parvularculaceae bacterium]